METLKNLTQYNWFVVVTAIVTAMLAFKFLSDLIEWFIKKFGIETKSMREKRENKKLITGTADSLNKHITESEKDRKALHTEQRALTNSINKLTKITVDKEISDYRWEIINLADKISEGKHVSKECLKHALATHAKYEVVIAENGLTNGEVDISMDIINDEYRKRLKDGAE